MTTAVSGPGIRLNIQKGESFCVPESGVANIHTERVEFSGELGFWKLQKRGFERGRRTSLIRVGAMIDVSRNAV